MLGIPSLDPYSALIKIATKISLVALVVLVIVGGFYEIKALKAEAKTLTIEKEAIAKERDSAIKYADAILENGIVVQEIMLEHETTIKNLEKDLKQKKKEIYDIVTSPVPKRCATVVADFFAPIGTALRMLRKTPEAGLSPGIETPKIDLSVGARPAAVN